MITDKYLMNFIKIRLSVYSNSTSINVKHCMVVKQNLNKSEKNIECKKLRISSG